jgi:hypothetical protein
MGSGTGKGGEDVASCRYAWDARWDSMNKREMWGETWFAVFAFIILAVLFWLLGSTWDGRTLLR